MQSITFVVAFAAFSGLCATAPAREGVIQKIPENVEETPLAIADASAASGAAAKAFGAGEETAQEIRERRHVAGHESDLLPSGEDVEASPFGESSQLLGHGRIRVLPAFLG